MFSFVGHRGELSFVGSANRGFQSKYGELNPVFYEMSWFPLDRFHYTTHVFCRSRLANGDEDKMSLHAGEPVLKGVKWIATRWLREEG